MAFALKRALSVFLAIGMVTLVLADVTIASADLHDDHAMSGASSPITSIDASAVDAHCAGHGMACLISASHCNSTALQDLVFLSEPAEIGGAEYHDAGERLHGYAPGTDSPPPRV
ncbi:MAG: hypothetical protein R8L07_02830 [Alphaproteobacteria bacterium]|nr:hypothetical protein [Alphaproteobacteria bacterium]